MATTQIVTFCLGDDTFAADVFCVERVIEYQRPKSIPSVPDWIEGIIEYQSRIVPTINLRRRFELPEAAGAKVTRIIVFNVEKEWIAAVVDSVHEVRTIDSASISAPPPMFRGLPCEYLRGVVREGDKLTIYLEIGRILSTNERILLREISEGSPAA
ncbi:MAG: purine-binding chemotaxis protein CheW [Gemmatimonadaceae bacterium]|nr:purine-binding chemotaxis protein CheW [Gemmatimonadaceae bacterium]